MKYNNLPLNKKFIKNRNILKKELRYGDIFDIKIDSKIDGFVKL